MSRRQPPVPVIARVPVTPAQLRAIARSVSRTATIVPPDRHNIPNAIVTLHG